MRHGLDKGDRIILFTGPLVERSAKAVELVKDFISKYFPSEVALRVCEVPIQDFYDAVATVKKALRKEVVNARKVIANLSGGMKIVSMAVLISLAILQPAHLLVEVEAEDSSHIINIPLRLLNLPRVEGARLEVLRKLIEMGGRGGVKELARELAKDESTIRRYLLWLKKAGLIEVKRLKPQIIEVTPIAKALNC